MEKTYYKKEIEKVAGKIEKTEGDFRFAVVADTHLDNSLPDTLENIKGVDEKVHFRCITHLGDFMNGNITEKYTRKILKEQMELFRKSVGTRAFYPAEGNHDGYFDNAVSFTNDIATDEMWYESTLYLQEYKNLSRKKNKPYFYVDYLEEKIRMIFVCSFSYTFKDGVFNKIYDIDKEELEWFKNEAVAVEKDWTVILFSHDIPFESLSDDESPNVTKENSIAMLKALVDAKNSVGFEVAAWFVGHFHGDLIKVKDGINFILLASETAYVPQLWCMAGSDGHFPERTLGTVTEDLWDSAILNRKDKTLTLIRFGAGEDRKVSY